MKQAQILDLLRQARAYGVQAEAAKDKPDQLARIGRELCKIQIALSDAMHHKDAVAGTILETVFVDTVNNRPQALPELFPLFAALCGDRESKMWLADVDWKVYDLTQR